MLFVKRWWNKEDEVVHFINPMIDPYGGSENRAISLCQSVGDLAPARIWSDRRVSPLLRSRAQIERIYPPFNYPMGGNLVFVGSYFRLGDWIRYTEPRRVIALFNTPDLIDLETFLISMSRLGMDRNIEMVYSSNWLKERAGLPGVVHQSPIDLARFTNHKRISDRKSFTIGRLSRDFSSKFHSDDIELFLDLANRGFSIRIMGGGCLADKLNHERIELLPAGHEPPEVFLSTLDAFLYRTNHKELFETFGRVVFEAMACGLPVVCGVNGGYRDNIVHGQNGFLFEKNEEAIECLELLRENNIIKNSICLKARRYVENLFSKSAMLEMAKFYID